MTERSGKIFASWEDAGIPVYGQRSGSMKVVCPECGPTRRNKRDRSLSVDLDRGLFRCHNVPCEFAGKIDGVGGQWVPLERTYVKPQVPDRTTLGPVAKTFLSKRAIDVETAESYGVYSQYREQQNGDWLETGIAFPYRKDGEVVHVKYRGLREKRFYSSKDSEPVFYNIDHVGDSENMLVLVEGECLTGEAEVLTPQGWIRFDEYDGQPVAQVHEGGKITMADPLAFVRKPYTGDLLRFRNGQRFQITVTPGHRMISVDRTDRWREWRAEDGVSAGDNIPRVGEMDGPGIPLTDDQIALALAVSADGAIDHRTRRSNHQPAEDRYVRFGFKKTRKVDRLRGLLERLGIEASDNSISDGFQSICFPLPDWVPGRMLPHEWIVQATRSQRELILSEIVAWDGNAVPGRNQNEYSSKHLANAEFVQSIAHTSGRVSTIIPRRNEHGEWFKVSILHGKTHTSMQTPGMKEPDRLTHDGMVYCVTVPTGMFLVREHGCITVTGNCDVLAFATAGIHTAISVPNGAPGLNKDGTVQDAGKKLACMESAQSVLESARRVYLATDNDEPGKVLRNEFIRRLGRERCFVVSWPDGCKDANDVLMQHGPEALETALREARPVPVEGIRYAHEFADEIWERRGMRNYRGIEVPMWERFTQLFRLGEGQLTVITGTPESGKSMFLRALLSLIARSDDSIRFGMFVPEDAPGYEFYGKLAKVQLGDLRMAQEAEYRDVMSWLDEHFVMIDPESKSLDDIMEAARITVLRHGIRVLVIDPWTEVLTDRVSSVAEHEHIIRCLAELQRFGKKYGLSIIVVAHPTKQDKHEGGGPVGPYSIASSAGWYNKPDRILSVYREIKHGESTTVEVHVMKTRNDDFGRNGAVAFACDPETGRYTELAFVE